MCVFHLVPVQRDSDEQINRWYRNTSIRVCIVRRIDITTNRITKTNFRSLKNWTGAINRFICAHCAFASFQRHQQKAGQKKHIVRCICVLNSMQNLVLSDRLIFFLSLYSFALDWCHFSHLFWITVIPTYSFLFDLNSDIREIVQIDRQTIENDASIHQSESANQLKNVNRFFDDESLKKKEKKNENIHSVDSDHIVSILTRSGCLSQFCTAHKRRIV